MPRKKICSAGNSANPFYMRFCSPCSTSFPASMPFYIMHPRIFEMAGFSQQASFLQPVYIGGANLLFTFLGMSIIDKVGRKTLLMTGAIGTAVFLALTAFSFHPGSEARVPRISL